jgi:hypothetical protein
MTCDKCGTQLELGDWPFCPHGSYRGGVVGDDIPGGFVQENFGDQPEVFYSKKAMLARADELGLQPYVKRLEKVREVVGGGKQWLADAEALAKRNGTAKADDLTWHSFESSVREIKSIAEVA